MKEYLNIFFGYDMACGGGHQSNVPPPTTMRLGHSSVKLIGPILIYIFY